MIPTQALPKHAAEDVEIAQLTDLYQAQLVELQAAHALLLADQERLAELLAPHLAPSGSISPDALQQLDPKVLLFKEGLDLRVSEFQEDCKRIQATERRLQNKIEKAAEEYERNFLQSSGLVDARVLKRVREQQRTIQVQQGELEQLRFEKEILQAENRRLKEMCIHQPDFAFGLSPKHPGDSAAGNIPSFHTVTEAVQRPLFGTTKTLHSSGGLPGMPAGGISVGFKGMPDKPSVQPESSSSAWLGDLTNSFL